MSQYATRVFWIVGALLTILTIVEYIVAVEFDNNTAILTIFALGKAVLIVYYFMHIYRIWRAEEH